MSWRKILFWIHLATGCLAGTIVLIMSVTGVLLAYERQITSWADRDYRSTPPAAGAMRLPIEAMTEKVTAQNGALPSVITLRTDPAAPAEVSFGREHVYLVDVYSGSVLGEGSQSVRTFFQKVENWHRWLGASLLLLVSGPFLWMPRRWSWQNVMPIALFRGGLSGRAREFNWHNVIGIWCAVPLFIIVLSGVVMSYPWANNLLYRLTGNEPPVQGNGPPRGAGGPRGAQRARRGEEAPPSLAGLNPLWARAEQQVPGWRSLTLRLPPRGRGPMSFTIDTGNGRPDQRAQLTLDRRTAEVVRWEPFSSYNASRRLRTWFRFLHTGEAGGIAGQTVAGIATAGAAMLVWTGIFLAIRRLSRWRNRRRSLPDVAARDRAMSTSR